MFTVGSVPFANARPLVAAFEAAGAASNVSVRYELPSLLPALLESGEAEAILVSSIEALSQPGSAFAEGVCIGSRGAAESVRLFSKVPFARIESLALDQSSLTSNALARILLAEVFSCRPSCSPQLPDLEAMLDVADAAILIGDKGLMASGEGLHTLDLGSAWTDLTGHPFVWALWTGRERLNSELAAHLNAALDWFDANADTVLRQTAEQQEWPEPLCRRYLTRTMSYRLEDRDLAGLRLFGELAAKHGLAESCSWPRAVSPRVAQRA